MRQRVLDGGRVRVASGDHGSAAALVVCAMRIGEAGDRMAEHVLERRLAAGDLAVQRGASQLVEPRMTDRVRTDLDRILQPVELPYARSVEEAGGAERPVWM